jgi:UDP-2-acetamido-3-amino-2,3-dideoxy-glucuronate N-acetyltransferase
MESFIHHSSFVDEGSKIGEGTKIWHFCHIFSGAIIGNDCVVGQGCNIASSVIIGNGCKLQNGISVYDGVVLEDDVFCGPHMIFTNVSNPRSFINKKSEFKKTIVRKGSSIGAGAIIVAGVEIGEFSFIGAGSVITKDVLPYSLVYGNPAIQHGWMTKLGNKICLSYFKDNDVFIDEDGSSYIYEEGNLYMEESV